MPKVQDILWIALIAYLVSAAVVKGRIPNLVP